MKCEQCRFWVTFSPGGTENREGNCRRFPPTPIASVYTDTPDERTGRSYSETSSAVESVWPETKATEWCGEYQFNGPHQSTGPK
jgi:hypothetical protein